MKYKLIDGSTFVLAGVSSYSNKTENSSTTNNTNEDHSGQRPKMVKMSFDFDIPSFTFDIDKEAIKKEAAKIKEEAMKFKEAAMRAKDDAMRSREKATDSKEEDTDSEEDTEEATAQKEETSNESNTSEHTHSGEQRTTSTSSPFPGMDDFSKYMNDFGKHMNAFGNSMGEYGKTLGKSMESWGKNFDKVFTKDFVDSMENTFKNIFGEDTPHESHKKNNFDQEINRHWTGNFTSDDYSLWQQEALFNELYENNETIRNADMSPDLFYEVQCYDLNTKMNDQLTFIGCQVKSTKELPYSVVTQRLSPKQWLVVKLTKEEFEKDWMQKVESLEILGDHTMDQYFILRHFKHSEQQQNSLYKIYIPLKETR